MDVAAAIRNRRAVKRFDPDHQMTAAEIEKLMSLAVLSPTAFNTQNWRFVLVRDPDLRRRIREKSFGQPQVTDASLLIILCADLKAWDRDPQRYWNSLQADARERLVGMIRGFYGGNDQVQRDEAMRSCGLAATTLMLAAQDMGYDSCPMDGFDFDAVGELIDLPADHVISMFVAVGKPLEPAKPRADRLPPGDVTIIDRFAAAD